MKSIQILLELNEIMNELSDIDLKLFRLQAKLEQRRKLLYRRIVSESENVKQVEKSRKSEIISI